MTQIIAGPCSFESFEQTEQVVKFLTERGIKLIRGGALKYRSNPNDYQGQYAVLSWMRVLKEKYDFVWVNEIYDSNHAMNQDIGILQIGSRNMHNTYLLKKLNEYTNVVRERPIILKRHYSAGLNEFLNHAAYLDECNVILCLRGIMGLWPQEQRFHPDVTDIARLRRLMEERQLFDVHIDPLKVSDIKFKYKICYDASHSACHLDYVENLIKCAYIYAPDYLMIEVHPRPDKALSDAQQQMDFKMFDKLIERGVIKC